VPRLSSGLPAVAPRDEGELVRQAAVPHLLDPFQGEAAVEDAGEEGGDGEVAEPTRVVRPPGTVPGPVMWRPGVR
jgi:hypothetical protein